MIQMQEYVVLEELVIFCMRFLKLQVKQREVCVQVGFSNTPHTSNVYIYFIESSALSQEEPRAQI